MSKRPRHWGRHGDDRTRSLSPQFRIIEGLKVIGRRLTAIKGWDTPTRAAYRDAMLAVPMDGGSLSASIDLIRREDVPPQGPDDSAVR